MARWCRCLAAVALAAALAAAPPAAPLAQPAGEPQRYNTELVGHLDPGLGPYGDVWVHDGTAYLGGYQRGDCRQERREALAIDVRDPAAPELLARLPGAPGSDAQDVWVGSVRTPAFTGDLAAVGLQPCDREAEAPGFGGLALYDVTDPARPERLALLPTGVRGGVHELGVVQRPDGRVLVLAAVPYSWTETGGARGDLRIIDATDPRKPRELADWDPRSDAPAELRAALAVRPDVFGHSAWPFDQGRKLFASFWAAGEIFLDIDDPARPRMIGRTSYPDGELAPAAHSGWFTEDEKLFVQNDETLRPVGPSGDATWTAQRIYDTTDLSNPVQVGAFATENAVPGRDGRIRRDGVYSVHNAVIAGDLEYVSWYSDGVRVVDISDPGRPREVGYFIPPPSPEAAGLVPGTEPTSGSFALVWGVHTDGELVFASDIVSGLWIFRYREGAGGGTPLTPPSPAGAAGSTGEGPPWLLVALLLGAAAVLVAVTLAWGLARRRPPGPPPPQPPPGPAPPPQPQGPPSPPGFWQPPP